MLMLFPCTSVEVEDRMNWKTRKALSRCVVNAASWLGVSEMESWNPSHDSDQSTC